MLLKLKCGWWVEDEVKEWEGSGKWEGSWCFKVWERFGIQWDGGSFEEGILEYCGNKLFCGVFFVGCFKVSFYSIRFVIVMGWLFCIEVYFFF